MDKKQVKRLLAEKEVFYKDEKETPYLESNVQQCYKLQKKVGDDYMALLLIHEFSHAALYTADYFYAANNTNEINPLPLYGLPVGNVSKKYQLLNYERRGGNTGDASTFQDLAYNNADSFALATTLLAYSASKQPKRLEQFNRFVINRAAFMEQYKQYL